MTKEEKIGLREAGELSRLEAMKRKGRKGWYFWLLFVIIILVNMLDEVSSSTGNTVTTNMIEDFFVRNPFFGKFYFFKFSIYIFF